MILRSAISKNNNTIPFFTPQYNVDLFCEINNRKIVYQTKLFQ